MKPKISEAFVSLTIFLILFHIIPCCFSENYNFSYQLLNKPDGSTTYTLKVAVSQSLYEYYTEKSHKLVSNIDFAKFVTPYALKPIADKLWEIYTNDEDFANGVLMIVHQIPYVETIPVKYPVETMVENKGDCDLFSFVAASIMKAGGLDVVLLYYESKAHMNVGVHLLHAPQDAREQVYYVTYHNVKYYVAECTGGNWEDGWRVGECPSDLRQADVQAVSLESCEQWAPGQVSASYKTLVPSTISLTTAPTCVIQGSTITLSGSLLPALQNKEVTIYIKINNSPWTTLDTVITDANGRFTYVLSTKNAGICQIRASWSGDSDYAGADSSIQKIIVLSQFLVLLLIIIIILICVGVTLFFVTRQSRQEAQEPQPPKVDL